MGTKKQEDKVERNAKKGLDKKEKKQKEAME